MQTESINRPIILNETSVNESPFVNDECGDTMWDDVLKNLEDKSTEI